MDAGDGNAFVGLSVNDLHGRLSQLSGGLRGVVPGILTSDATVLSLPGP